MGRSERKRTARAEPFAFHADFSATIHSLLGDEARALEASLKDEPPVSIRVNTTKWTGPDVDPVPWSTAGRYLSERPAFTFDPLFHAGCYYVQEASSMLLEQAVKASGFIGQDIMALDLCAAPGGKTTHLRSLLSQGSLLVANEVDRKRQAILTENVRKWGIANTVITGSDPSALSALPHFFDLVVVDAPCSGEGMFRKDPFAREQWSPALVTRCAVAQRAILRNAWESMRPGGILIYSTCTWEEAENEMQLAQLLPAGATCMEIPLDDTWGAVRSDRHGISGVRCYPHRMYGEGFFIAMLRKDGGTVRSRPLHPRQSTLAINPILHVLREPGNWSTREHGEAHYAVHRNWAHAVAELCGVLRVLSPGLPIMERKGAELRPHSALALSVDLLPGAFPVFAVDHTAAIEYLKGHSLPAADIRGPVLATFEGVGVGWLQGVGKRFNNRWPIPWRIRAQQASAPHVSWARGSDARS